MSASTSAAPKPPIKKNAITTVIIYKGERKCTQCERLAYYTQYGIPRCGFHSKKSTRRNMPLNPVKEAEKRAKMQNYYAAACANTEKKISLRRLHQFGAFTPSELGFFTVLPNMFSGGPFFPSPAHPDFVIKLRNFSPMRLGPIEHLEPDLPVAKSLENWYQGRKVFRSEVVDVDGGDLTPLPRALEARMKRYQDSTPHRHKLGNTKKKHMEAAGLADGENVNVALYTLFRNRFTREEKRYTYIQGRMFYCCWYERLVRRQKEWERLLALYKEGRSLLICGPDARDHEGPLSQSLICDWYRDESIPFGHEMVLATMLFLHESPLVQPWRCAWNDEFGMTFEEYYSQ